jgi:hypothetical protein
MEPSSDPVHSSGADASLTDTPSAGILSLGIDGVLLLVAGLVAFLFSRGIALAQASEIFQRATANLEGVFLPPQWLVMGLGLLAPLGLLGLDALNWGGRNSLRLPCAGSQNRARQIYAKRLHLCLLALYFDAILVVLCWSAGAMPLVSKLFVAAILSLAIYALGQSIPTPRLSFLVSGILFVAVLGGTQLFMTTKIRALQEAGRQQLLQELTNPPAAAPNTPTLAEPPVPEAEQPSDQPIGQTEGRARNRIRTTPSDAAEPPAEE